MVRAPCCEKMELKKGPWTPEEDQLLVSYINKHGHGNWRALPKQAGLLRCGKSCKQSWINYLRPDIEKGNLTAEEGTVSTGSHNPQPPDEAKTAWRSFLLDMIKIIHELDVGKPLLGWAISMGVALAVSASSLVQTIPIHAVAISLSFAVVLICINLLLHKIYPRISALMLVFGYALMMLSFYAVLASYLPLHLKWIPLLCFLDSFILPFAMIAWASFRTDRREDQAP